jgi:hypothetical protein
VLLKRFSWLGEADRRGKWLVFLFRWVFLDNNPMFLNVPVQIQSKTHLKSEKPIFDSGYSPTSVFIMAGSLLLCTSLLVFILFHIRHYPIAGTLLSLFLLRTILDARVEKIVVLEDRFVIITRYLLPFMTKRDVVLLSVGQPLILAP